MAEKIRVLIVDDNEDTRDGTRRLLEYDDDVEIVGFAENGQVAVDLVAEYDPHVILMDINMPVMNGIEATQIITQRNPNSKVVIVSVQDDPNYLRSAQRAGAIDSVPKPITSDELTSAIHRAYGESQRSRTVVDATPAAPTPPGGYPGGGAQTWPPMGGPPAGKVIAVTGNKGGVGKTTLAISIGVGLVRANREKRILVVDANVNGGDVGVCLNTRGQFSIIEACYMVQEEELDTQQLEGVVVQHDSGIKLILAPGNPLESDPLPTQSFHTLIENLRRFYDYIIIDTAPFLDEALVAVIQSADEVVVVTTSTMPALKDTRILFNLIQQLKEAPEGDDSAAGKDHIFLVLNQFDPKVSRITPDQIANFLKHRIDAEIPFDLAGAVGSMNNGIPWITVDPRRSPAVQPQMNMVQIIRERFEKTSVAAASDAAPAARQPGRGLFGR